MRVLGLDPSLRNFGWVVLESGEPLDHGRFQTSASQLFISRYCDLRQRLTDLVSRYQIQYVGCEYPVFKDLYSEGMYGLYLYTCEALWGGSTDVVFFSPGQVKAHARVYLERPQTWKMAKADMVEACAKITSQRWNHNEADAFWIARVAWRFWLLQQGHLMERDLDPLEKKQFLEVQSFLRGKKAGSTVKRGILYREDERFFRWSVKNGDQEEEGEG